MATTQEGELFQPKRYAIKFNPPRFILEYTDGKKTRIRSVSLRIPKEPDAEAMAKGIMKTFPRRLNKAGVKPEQVERLVRRMIDKCEVLERSRRNSDGTPSQSPKAGAGGAGDGGDGAEDADIFSEDVDLNVVSPEKLEVAKAKMDEDFVKNRKVLGDEGFVYDVQKEFNPTQANDWDSSDEEGEGDDV